MTLQEIKDQYAKELGLINFDNLVYNSLAKELMKLHLSEIAERYAKARVNEILENLDLSIRYDDTGREGCTWGDTDFDSKSVEFGYNNAIEVVKELILKLKVN